MKQIFEILLKAEKEQSFINGVLVGLSIAMGVALLAWFLI